MFIEELCPRLFTERDIVLTVETWALCLLSRATRFLQGCRSFPITWLPRPPAHLLHACLVSSTPLFKSRDWTWSSHDSFIWDHMHGASWRTSFMNIMLFMLLMLFTVTVLTHNFIQSFVIVFFRVSSLGATYCICRRWIGDIFKNRWISIQSTAMSPFVRCHRNLTAHQVFMGFRNTRRDHLSLTSRAEFCSQQNASLPIS